MPELTIFTSFKPTILSKRFSLRNDGTLAKETSAYMYAGEAVKVTADRFRDLSNIYDFLAQNQAVSYGVHPDLLNARIVRKNDLAENPGAIARSDDHFKWPASSGVFMTDYDPGEGSAPLSRDELLGALFSAAPGLSACGWLWRPSASSCIYRADTGEQLIGVSGQRVYFMAKDAKDVVRAGEVLFKRLWLAGYGRIEIAQNGSLLVRSPIDSSVWQPSRLDFAAGAVCGQGLVRTPEAAVIVEGAPVDTRAVLADLTPAESQQYEQMVDQAKRAAQPQAADTRKQYAYSKAPEWGVTPDEALAMMDVADTHRVLCGDYPVYLDDGEVVSVKTLLSDPGKYDKRKCLDPIEPDYRNKAVVGIIHIDSQPNIFSRAHGDRTFTLGIDTALAFAKTAAPVLQIGELSEKITSTGGLVSNALDLLNEIDQNGGNALQKSLLTGQLQFQLKEAGAWTKDVQREFDKRKPVAVDTRPLPTQGAFIAPNIPLNPDAWAVMHTKGKDRKPKGTLDNFKVLLAAYGVVIEYNEISKNLKISGPGIPEGGTLLDEAALAHLDHLANLNEYPKAENKAMVMAVAARNTINPVIQWIESRTWDGIDRVSQLFACITLHPEEDEVTAEVLFRKWLRGAVAIGTGVTKKMEYVLTMVDPEGGAGKTRFFTTLCPPDLRKDSVTLDTTNKDSIKIATSYWLVELGELDGTFSRSDQAKLKAFLSAEEDEIRLPYGRAYLRYPRRTAYFASVNSSAFLVDGSGNRRFWPIRVIKANHQHNIDMQQVWAQVAVEIQQGQIWYLTDEETHIMAARNEEFRVHSRAADGLSSIMPEGAPCVEHLTVTECLLRAGIHAPTKGDLNEGATWLRKRGYTAVKRRGKRGYMVPSPVLATAAAFTVIEGGKRE